MIIQAELRRKQSEYEGEACAVDKVILKRAGEWIAGWKKATAKTEMNS